MSRFPDQFVWGAATAAYQVEGAAYSGGRGLSIWDVFCKTPGKVFNGHNGDTACDQYNRYKEDIAIMKELGIKAYRLSISWPRIIPNGVGQVNEEGIANYDRLVDELLENGIEPYVTLFHWDFPYELYKLGGWLNRDVAEWFGEYTKIVVKRLGDRVKYWMTQNEPLCYIYYGHYEGSMAPGLKLSWKETLQIAHNSMRAHGNSVMAIRSASKLPNIVGCASNGRYASPYSDRAEDVEAAQQYMFGTNIPDKFTVSMLHEPIIFGHYPQSMWDTHGAHMPEIEDGDLEMMCQPMDFLGINIYAVLTSEVTSIGPCWITLNGRRVIPCVWG
ncbi:glycoside hydrolase family 1 protein [Paenibacillus roseipurpureus]|uniref:Family 1 glycosylhydrolase n=1 Tax=Paenibacillus roseopurpureus TaxID=2918901 RepID=A0AA96LRT3_9BACL|nr:family 1 glycosylhydrolase [Paenibacillus sp. MBLB1832]WNR46051.1 family 1 glycosylhydrolase [Paenibacillus sp. MBLB1832]